MNFIKVPFFFIYLTSFAQNEEIFLNQGELDVNPILLESKRILINCSDKISFWDIDRSMLLKTYSVGNQFTSNFISTQSPKCVSPKGNFFVTAMHDSLVVYNINTQERIKSLPYLIPLFSNDAFCQFTKNENFLLLKLIIL